MAELSEYEKTQNVMQNLLERSIGWQNNCM